MTKRHKPNTPKKTLIINSSNSATAFQWKNPKDNSRPLSNSIDFWIEYAKLAERGKLNAIFIADHYSAFDSYKGPNNWELAFKNGVNAARIDPSIVATAVTQATDTVSLGITFSTLSEHPYLQARKLASLDQFTKGRFGWNIVSSYLESSARQLLNGQPFPEHDERYVRTEEYVDVVIGLLASSWREDALVNDGDTFVDPDRVRQIDHVGKYFQVPGPAITEPSPQRIPLVVQAGSSRKGKILAAELAEVVFLDIGNPTITKKNIELIKRAAKEAFGRDPNNIKFIVPLAPIIGKTEEEAEEKYQDLIKYIDDETTSLRFSGISGIDIGKYELDEEVTPKNKSNASIGMTDARIKDGKGKARTKRQILSGATARSKFVGTAQQVADAIEEYVEDYDIDGFNFGFGSIFPNDLKDIVDLLIPELQERGLFWKDYPVKGGSFRENVYGEKGHKHLPDDHPYSKLIWKAGVPKAKFELQLRDFKKELIKGRAKAAEIITS